MLDKSQEYLFNLFVTQKSVHSEMLYDVIEKAVKDSITNIKEQSINAKIANLALNINEKLVIAQLYIERKNGLLPTQNPSFGTSPTCYNVQLRFPFGFEGVIAGNPILVPNGDFFKPLSPCLNESQEIVVDEVKRDFGISQVIKSDEVGLKQNSEDGTYLFGILNDSNEAVYLYPFDIAGQPAHIT